MGSIYAVAAWFKLVGVGYETSESSTAWSPPSSRGGLLHAAGRRILATAGERHPGAGVFALVLDRAYPVGALVQEGPLRFGLPMGVILALVAGRDGPARASLARGAAMAIVAIASIWAFEAFVYTAATFTAMTCFQGYLLPAGGRMRWLARQAAMVAGACLGAHLLFDAVTLIATGDLPDWSMYLAYLRAFLFGNVGDITYDVPRWSPGIALGAGYLASAVAVALLVRLRREVVERERVTVMALVGTTGFGVLLFSYFVDRSAGHVVIYVALPALLSAALWLSMLLRSERTLPRGAGLGALALVLTVGALMVSVSWSTAAPRFGHTALAHVIPGGESVGTALDRIRHFPPVLSRSPVGARLLDRYMPGQHEVVVIVNPSYAGETLVESGRVNRLPLANLAPWDDGRVAEKVAPLVRDGVEDLKPGDRLLLDQTAVAALAKAKADPANDPLQGVAGSWPRCRCSHCARSTAGSACGRSTATSSASWWFSSRGTRKTARPEGL